MNLDQPHVPLTLDRAAELIIDAGEFSKTPPADQRDWFMRNVTAAVVGSAIAGLRP